MNELEQYLRESGRWTKPIPTDWRGRAISGGWWPRYYSAWSDVHGIDRKSPTFDPGGWTQDGRWATSTPQWDIQWFKANGVKPPKRLELR